LKDFSELVGLRVFTGNIQGNRAAVRGIDTRPDEVDFGLESTSREGEVVPLIPRVDKDLYLKALIPLKVPIPLGLPLLVRVVLILVITGF